MWKFFSRIKITQEYCLYLLAFTIALVFPFFEMGRSSLVEGTFHWNFILQRWMHFLPFAVAVAVHNFLLAPILIEKKWPLTYILSVILLLGSFFLYDRTRYQLPQYPPRLRRTQMEAPMRFYRLDDVPKQPEFKPLPPPHELGLEEMAPSPKRRGNIIIDVLVVFLFFGCNIAIKLFYKRQKDMERMDEMEKAQLHQELAQLKAQMSPHFFMNSLNNIHGMMDIDTEKAQAMILELSGMMRYVLYESTTVMIPLVKEIGFLRNYISLMLIRYNRNTVDINCHFPDEEETKFVSVPPLVYINFIENAFKHGVNYQSKSFVDVQLHIDSDSITFRCVNSIFKKETAATYDGVGLSNIRKRLDILYSDKYSLDIAEREDKYSVTLTIPIHGTNKMYSSR